MKIVLVLCGVFALAIYFWFLFKGKLTINGAETNNVLTRVFMSLVGTFLITVIIWLPIIGIVALITYLLQ